MTNQTTPSTPSDRRRYFTAMEIDGVPELLEQSYRLRHQVYCRERMFLDALKYPQELETDEFDRHSIHVGAVDARGVLAGTARVVTISELGLPLFRYCTTFPDQTDPAKISRVEVGRLSVSRRYRRRADDDVYGLTVTAADEPSTPGAEKRRGRDEIFLTVLKALYQATKRIGATHWLAAMEKSLERLLAQHGLPFVIVGPESDYLGIITPYQMDLRELDRVILSRRFPALEEFVLGLEPQFCPQPAVERPAGTATGGPAIRIDVEGSGEARHRGPVFGPETEVQLLNEFRRAAATVPAYRTLLDEDGVDVERIRDLRSFAEECPLLSKRNTFNRFPLAQLSVGGTLDDVADVLTSSGHGGHFSFGVISRAQAAAGAEFIDRAFDAAFAIASRKTLVINCLPMGVIFSSNQMTVATTSVREDMAAALVEAFGGFYDQVVLAGDPLFLKRLTDHADERGLDWTRYRMNAILGEEIFGEHYRGYLSARLGLDVDQPGRGYVMSSFGVGELGLHLCYETPATIGLRRAAFTDASFARDLLGASQDEGVPLPMIFSFDPTRTFIEVSEPNALGYGRLTISMLAADRTIPLLRYQTGDIVRLLDPAEVAEAACRHGVTLGTELPPALLALLGREQEALPNGSHVAFYKDALYADQWLARRLTGAFRVSFDDRQCTLHVQLALGQGEAPAILKERLLQVIPFHARPQALLLWPYAQFPFGMRLDYERKFSHHLAGQDVLAPTFEPAVQKSPA